MNELVNNQLSIAPMTDDAINQVRRLEQVMLTMHQVSLDTHHVLHGGMYARTLTLPAGTLTSGALVKVPTIVILDGHCKLFTGTDSVELNGRHVIAASAYRKQAVLAYEETKVTMIFATDAESIHEAEVEFTDEHDMLMTNKNLANSLSVITGEKK